QKNPITNKRHQTNWHQKNKQPHPKREKERGQNNKQKPPNTLLSSQTTRPSLSRRNSAAKSR
ncbi:hypothetical protein, partial [Mycolicibacterium fortuitum]